MVRRAHVTAFVLLCGVALAAAWASAQAIQPRPVLPPVTVMGDDIAFRVEMRVGSRVTGRLLVRMDGEWVETEVTAGPALRRLDVK